MDEVQQQLETVRQPGTLVIVYTVFYAAIFVVGLVGNVFVVLAILLNTNLRSVTDYLISSLALADLLIILFCLPTTLMNNLLTEWQLGSIGCKLSTFINSTTSCASIFTLVAVTADRYVAICHTLKYTLWEARSVVCLIVVIWFASAMLASPNLVLYDEIIYDLLPPNGTLVARLCVSIQDDFLHFIIVNLIIAFVLPMVLISVSYALIFITVTNRQGLAVDARIRDERVKFRVAQMMLTVIIVFTMCWTPLYALYFYFFMTPDRESGFFQAATSVLRPIFQWLSLLSSALNPLIYIAYSHKYRRAFHQLLLLPCRLRYQSIRRATRATLRLAPLKSDVAATASLGVSDNYAGPTCTFCYSSYMSTPAGGGCGRCRKTSLPHSHYYYYHRPTYPHNSYSSYASARTAPLSPNGYGCAPRPRKMSDQTACAVGGRRATFISRNSEAMLMCGDSTSRRCIEESREIPLRSEQSTKRLSFCDDRSDANNNKHNKSVSENGYALQNASVSSSSPINDSGHGISFFRSPLKFFHRIFVRRRQSKAKGQRLSATKANDSVGRRRINEMTSQKRLSAVEDSQKTEVDRSASVGSLPSNADGKTTNSRLLNSEKFNTIKETQHHVDFGPMKSTKFIISTSSESIQSTARQPPPKLKRTSLSLSIGRTLEASDIEFVDVDKPEIIQTDGSARQIGADWPAVFNQEVAKSEETFRESPPDQANSNITLDSNPPNKEDSQRNSIIAVNDEQLVQSLPPTKPSRIDVTSERRVLRLSPVVVHI